MPSMPGLGPIFDKLLPYVIILVLGSLAVFVYLTGRSLTLDVITVVIGVAGGVIAAYFLNFRLSQEKKLEFHEGEEVILQSTDTKSHVVILSIGDEDFPFEPIKANIYLTNIGILAEPPDSGEVVVYVPLDKITEFAPHQNGIRIRYVDVNIQFAEVLLYVDDRDTWIQTLANQLNAVAY
jgi:hypothetical protein